MSKGVEVYCHETEQPVLSIAEAGPQNDLKPKMSGREACAERGH
ncbi:hypothetical protein PP182_11175 [Maribacter sp. PR1]|uniref:Uncharacterized protein n=1 Tax=Maribacter cobaltidurans TaxID=1178778 RepID=A0ABU7IUH9_9FLAO|nr:MULTISPECIES: hypothetical protein [Maribacter]MDC6389245.1 hypothetical protein [Maribacter sp. PR1]MEE1976632.1 hypothetical protein [Maribacter cobaltidurans]